MITLITGLPGSGKSLYTLKTVNDLATKENRQVYYHGIPELTLPWILMQKAEDWVDLPTGSIFVIDESQATFRPRGNGAPVPRHVSEFETHRHKGYDGFLITLHPMLLDGNVRRLVGRHYHVERFFGFPKSKIHEFQKVRDYPDKSTKNSIENHFVYPKEVYSWYKSADLHTVKKRIPMRLIMMLLLPLFLMAVLYYGYQSFTKVAAKPDISKPQTTIETITADNTLKQKPELTYVQKHTAELSDFPHTAPAYVEVVKPVTAPYPAACVVFRNKCTCYSQQGTKMAVSILTCNQIVTEGFFVDWDTQPKNRTEGVSSQNVTYAEHVSQQPQQTVSDTSRNIALNLPVK